MNKRIIVLITVISLLLISGSGCSVYDKFRGEEVTENKEANETVDNNLEEAFFAGSGKPVNSELKNVFRFANYELKGDAGKGLVAIKSNGETIKIYESNLFSYLVTDYMIFAAVEDEIYENIVIMGYIDLTQGNGNYEFNVLDIPATYYLALIGSYIYYTPADNWQDGTDIYEYNLKTKESNKIINRKELDNSEIWFSAEEKLLFYTKEYEVGDFRINDIYMYDLKTKKETKIADNANIEFKNNDKLIYAVVTSDDTDNYTDDVTYYEYNIKTRESVKIVSTYLGGGTVENNDIVPYDTGYVYIEDDQKNISKSKLYRINVGSEKELIYTINKERAVGISLVAANKVQVAVWIPCGRECSDVKYITINIDTKKEVSAKYKYYWYGQYVDFTSDSN